MNFVTSALLLAVLPILGNSQLIVTRPPTTTSVSVIASSRTQSARFIASPGRKTSVMMSPRQHHTLKLTVRSNPKALRGRGNFPEDVEWIPLNPVEYKNLSIESNRTKSKLRWNNFPPTFTSGKTTSKPIEMNQMMWMQKLASNLDDKIIPLKLMAKNDEIKVENKFMVKSGILRKTDKPRIVTSNFKKTTPKTNPNATNSYNNKVWVPVSITIPPFRVSEVKTTTEVPRKKESSTVYKWQTGYEANYFHTSEDPLTSALLSGVLSNTGNIAEYLPPTTTRKYHSFFTYLTRPWITTTPKYGIIRKSTTPTQPSTTFTVTAHPLIVTSPSNEASNEWFPSNENSLENTPSTHKPIITSIKFKPLRQTTYKPSTKSTTQSNQDRIMYNPPPIYKPTPPIYKPTPPIYKPTPPIYKPTSPIYKPTTGYASPSTVQYYTTRYPETESNALNSVVSFLATASHSDITQAAYATRKTTKRPPTDYGTYNDNYNDNGISNAASSSGSSTNSRWGSNRLQRLLLAIGMSVIPTAALAVLVGFPSLLVGRRRRALDDEKSMEEVFDKLKILENSKAPDVWMNDADVTLQKYCSQIPLRKKSLKRRLRGDRAWKGVAEAVRYLLNAQCNQTTFNGIDKGGPNGVVYVPTSQGTENLIRSKSRTKFKGNGARPTTAALAEDAASSVMDVQKFDWDEFVCKTFWTLIDDDAETEDHKSKVENHKSPLPVRNLGNEKSSKNSTKISWLRRKTNSRLDNSKSAARKFHTTYKHRKSNSSKEPMAMIIVQHDYQQDKKQTSPTQKNVQNKNEKNTEKSSTSSRRMSFPFLDLSQKWRNLRGVVDVLDTNPKSSDAHRHLRSKVKLNKIFELPLTSSFYSVPRTRRSTPSDGLRMSIKAMVHQMADGSVNSHEQMTSPQIANSKIIKSPLSKISENLQEGKLYIYHILSSPKENKTSKISKRKHVNFLRRRATTSTSKSNLVNQIKRVQTQKKLKVKGSKFTFSKEEDDDEEDIERINNRYGMPTIFRIPIHVENSTPEYMHILGKPIPWSIVENISGNYLGKPTRNRIKTTTEKSYHYPEFNFSPIINKPQEESPSKPTSSFSVNSSSASGPMTINIYTVHGLENGLLSQILNNIPGIIDSQIDRSTEDFEENIPETTTKRTRRPITSRPRPISQFTTTRRFRPILGRPRPCIRPFGRQQVIDDCEPEEPSPVPVTTTRRPPVKQKPMLSLLDLIYQKFGLHGGLLPLLELGKWNRNKYWSYKPKIVQPKWTSDYDDVRARTSLTPNDLDNFLDEKKNNSMVTSGNKELDSESSDLDEVAKLMKNFLLKELNIKSKENKTSKPKSKTINVFITPEKNSAKRGKVEKIDKIDKIKT